MRSTVSTSTALVEVNSSSRTYLSEKSTPSATAADSESGTDCTNPHSFLSDLEKVIWVGAFFDAEGTVHLTNRGHLQVRLTNTDRAALEIAREVGGGYIYKCKGKNKALYRLYLNGSKAIKFLKKILPYTVVKREAIKYAIEYFENGKKDIDKYRKLINTTLRGDNGGQTVS